MRILLVEDDDATAGYLARVMAEDGHDVDRVSDGAHALTHALGERYDVLVCDLGLPDLHGTDVIRALKAQAPHLPVIVVTALDPVEWKEPALAAGASGFLQKPVRVHELREELALVAASTAALKVVVVAPDDLERAALARDLDAHGVRVMTAASFVASGLDGEAVTRPDLVVVDTRLPDTLAVLARCVALGIPAVSVASTGGADDDTLMRAGAALVLTRPVDVEGLLIQTRFLAGR